MQTYTVIALWACAVVCRASTYTTYIGDANPYQVSAIATDAAGNTYITGSRFIGPAPVAPSYSYLPVTDVFVAKLDPAGNVTLLATFSGKGTDRANGIAVDPSGNIYVAGVTTSTDFPLHHPLQSVSYTGFGGTGFLVKLSADGTVLYSTYLGGTKANSSLDSVAADANGNAYVTGTTQAQDYPHTQGMPAGAVYPTGAFAGISGAFFAKIDPVGGILYAGALSTQSHDCGFGSTCFLGPVYTSGAAIAVDPAGNAYIAGNAGGLGLPTTPGALLADGIGAFVAKVDAAGTSLAYLTYLGAANYIPEVAPNSNPGNKVFAIAVDAVGNAYIAGSTSDPAFPATARAFQTALAGPPGTPFAGPPSDAFIAKLDPAGAALVWATFLGGSAADSAETVAIDSVGNVWASGTTSSADFPTDVSVTPKGSEFLVELNATGSALSYSALFPTNTASAALAVDSTGTVHVAGGTGLISAFPAGSPPGQASGPWMFGVTSAAGGVLSGRVAPGELISIYGLQLGPASPISAAFNAAGFLPAALGGVQVTLNGVSAPLLYVSGTQINAVAPMELTAASSIALQIRQNGALLVKSRMQVDIAAPQVFRGSNGSAVAINQDGTLNTPSNPAKAGSYVAIWATGTGFFVGSDGQMATGASQFCSSVGYCGVFEVNGNPLGVPYIGAAPGTVNGVVQINFQVAATDTYYFSVDGINSDTFSVFTRP